jgi:hypothetical protein
LLHGIPALYLTAWEIWQPPVRPAYGVLPATESLCRSALCKLRSSPQDRCIPVLWYELPNLPYPCAPHAPRTLIRYRLGLPVYIRDRFRRDTCASSTAGEFDLVSLVHPPCSRRSPSTFGARGRRAGDRVASVLDRSARPSRIARSSWVGLSKPAPYDCGQSTRNC